jgi:hypothetical protein
LIEELIPSETEIQKAKEAATIKELSTTLGVKM